MPTKEEIIEKLGMKDKFIDDPKDLYCDFISTGILAVDLATAPHRGGGGIPRGRLIELFGPYQSGKTTLALSIVREFQRQNLDVTIFEPENSYNPEYAKIFGVDNKKITFNQDNVGEDVFDAIEAFVANNVTDLILLDSLPALSSTEILTSDMKDDDVASDARMNAKAWKKLKGLLNRTNTTLLMINQMRDKPGVMYGKSETTPGGRAKNFWCDMRIRVRAKKPFYKGSKESKEKYGHTVEVVIEKNKLGRSGKRAWFDLYYDKGIDKGKDIKKVGIKIGVIERSGNWLKFIYEDEDEEIEIHENGKDNFFEAIRNHEKSKQIFKQIKEKVKGHFTKNNKEDKKTDAKNETN